MASKEESEQAAEELRKYYTKIMMKEEKARLRELDKTNVDKKVRDKQTERQFLSRTKKAKNVDLEIKSKEELYLSKKEFKRREFLRELLEHKDDKKKLRKLLNTNIKVDPDFSIIIGVIPRSLLFEKIGEIIEGIADAKQPSKRSKNKDSLGYLENVILESQDKEMIEKYEMNKNANSRRKIIDSIIEETDPYKQKMIIKKVKQTDPAFYPYLKAVENKTNITTFLDEYINDKTTTYIEEFLNKKLSSDPELASEYEKIKEGEDEKEESDQEEVEESEEEEKKEGKEEKEGKSQKIRLTKKFEEAPVRGEYDTTIAMKGVYEQDIAKRKQYKHILSIEQKREAEIGDCMSYEIRKPWINNYDSTWISSPSDMVVLKDEYIKKVLSSASQVNTPGVTAAIKNNTVKLELITLSDDSVIRKLTYNGKVYYEPSIKYNKLLCDSFTILEQENKTLKVMKKQFSENGGGFEEKIIEQFQIIHLTKNGRVLEQDESFYNKEIEYRIFLTKNIMRIKNYVLSNYKIDARSVEVLKNIVKEEILKYDINLDEKYLSVMLDNLVSGADKGQNIELLFRKAAKILIFLDNNLLAKNFNFRNRFVNKYYKPANVFSLKFFDLVPEIYFNIKFNKPEDYANVVKQFNYFINFKLEEVVISFVNKISSVTNMRFNRKANPFPYDIVVDNCENKNEADKPLPSYLYFPYTENSKQYCIFGTLTDTNPFTGVKYSDPKFIELISNLNMDAIDNHVTQLVFGEPEEEKKDDVNNQPASSSFEEKEFLGGYNQLDKEILSELLLDLDSLESDLLKKEEEKHNCEYCDKYIKEDLYKTIVKRSDNYYENVKFCNLNCFEKWSPKNKS